MLVSLTEWVNVVLRRFLHNNGNIATKWRPKSDLCLTEWLQKLFKVNKNIDSTAHSSLNSLEFKPSRSTYEFRATTGPNDEPSEPALFLCKLNTRAGEEPASHEIPWKPPGSTPQCFHLPAYHGNLSGSAPQVSPSSSIETPLNLALNTVFPASGITWKPLWIRTSSVFTFQHRNPSESGAQDCFHLLAYHGNPSGSALQVFSPSNIETTLNLALKTVFPPSGIPWNPSGSAPQVFSVS